MLLYETKWCRRHKLPQYIRHLSTVSFYLTFNFSLRRHKFDQARIQTDRILSVIAHIHICAIISNGNSNRGKNDIFLSCGFSVSYRRSVRMTSRNKCTLFTHTHIYVCIISPVIPLFPDVFAYIGHVYDVYMMTFVFRCHFTSQSLPLDTWTHISASQRLPHDIIYNHSAYVALSHRHIYHIDETWFTVVELRPGD